MITLLQRSRAGKSLSAMEEAFLAAWLPLPAEERTRNGWQSVYLV
jgi:hypothetical protein